MQVDIKAYCSDTNIPNSTLIALEQKFPSFNLDHSIKKVNDSGLYQKVLLLCCLGLMFSGAYSISSLALVMPDPIPLCQYDLFLNFSSESNERYETCSEGEHEACSLTKENKSERFDCSKQNMGCLKWPTKDSWTQKYDVYCEGESTRIRARTQILILNMLICFSILSLTDIIGRKKTLIVCNIIFVTGLLTSSFIPYFEAKIFGMCLIFGAEGAYNGLLSIFVNEFARRFSI